LFNSNPDTGDSSRSGADCQLFFIFLSGKTNKIYSKQFNANCLQNGKKFTAGTGDARGVDSKEPASRQRWPVFREETGFGGKMRKGDSEVGPRNPPSPRP
jgi:hypothetical protein